LNLYRISGLPTILDLDTTSIETVADDFESLFLI